MLFTFSIYLEICFDPLLSSQECFWSRTPRLFALLVLWLREWPNVKGRHAAWLVIRVCPVVLWVVPSDHSHVKPQ